VANHRYYHVSPRFWQDPKVRAWPEDMRMLALYLKSSPHRNMVGLFYCPLAYIASDLQWDMARLDAAFTGLLQEGYIAHDPDAQLVLIVDALADDPPDNPNQRKHAVGLVQELPTTPLVETLIQTADEVCPELADDLRTALGTPSKPLPKSSGTAAEPSDNPSETDSNTDPDSRFRIPDSQVPSSASGDAGREGHLSPAEVVQLWNTICGDVMPKVRMLTDERRRKVKARQSKPGRDLAWWTSYFRRIRASPFCCGDGPQGWVADFDFAVRSEAVVAKVLEGKYDPRPTRPDLAGPKPQRLRDMTDEATEFVAPYYGKEGQREQAASE